ncbi:hypothetical protein [Bosea sp. BIWAKO-01]|uniref:hypothetical protein n=1 Tax=Bosea sp. BIWAKO-01 TaxID=506668 RepID=UPI00085375C1|nr:hypothetical protein [Bosea sp. BIWAKO-01]GAU83923.1 hypothetical protein BIWAKO_03852 [Bosea sp. BIWAKO-01]
MQRRNLLSARDRLGASIIELIAADVAEHGPEVVEQLRLKNVAAYARLVSDLVHFRKLATERNTQTRRRPRALRLKDVLRAMDDQPIDVNNPLLPPKHRERWLKGIEALSPRSPYDFSPSELAALWGADLASWFERHARGVP